MTARIILQMSLLRCQPEVVLGWCQESMGTDLAVKGMIAIYKVVGLVVCDVLGVCGARTQIRQIS